MAYKVAWKDNSCECEETFATIEELSGFLEEGADDDGMVYVVSEDGILEMMPADFVQYMLKHVGETVVTEARDDNGIYVLTIC